MLKKLLNDEIKKRDLKTENKHTEKEESSHGSEDESGFAGLTVEIEHAEKEQEGQKKGFLSFLKRKANKLQKLQEKKKKKEHKFKNVIKTLLLAKKIAMQMKMDLQHHKAHKGKDQTKALTASVVKILYTCQHKNMEESKNQIKAEVLSIANLMNSHQALCMEVLINQIRTNPGIDPSLAIHLEKFAKREFNINDGTPGDRSLKSHSLERFNKEVQSEGRSM